MTSDCVSNLVRPERMSTCWITEGQGDVPMVIFTVPSAPHPMIPR